MRRSQPTQHLLHLGSVTVDPARARATKTDAELDLSAVEYRLLLLFASKAGGIVTRHDARKALWGDSGAYVEENTLSVYIRRLRDKIEDDPTQTRSSSAPSAAWATARRVTPCHATPVHRVSRH